MKPADNITSPIVVGNTVYVAAEDAHTLYALSRQNGKTAWTFQAGGRIDSPPTVVGNTVFFGSRDGWVYALDAQTGALAWRFRAAPEARQMGVGRKLQALRQDGTTFRVEVGLNPYTDHDRQLVLASIIDLSAREATPPQAAAG